MSFDWLNYVELALRLLRNREVDIEEAYLRASISRAYYGVFGALWDKRRRPGFGAHASKHYALIMQLRNSADPFDQEVGFALDRLRRARNIADYEPLAVITPVQARKAYNLAAFIQQRVQAL